MGWEPQKFYSDIVMSQLNEKESKNNSFFQQAENQNAEDGTHQIPFKINEKSWRKF